jgi:hypothetical protein
MTIREWIDEQVEMYPDEEILVCDGYDDCIIGLVERMGQTTSWIVCYDRDMMIQKIAADMTSGTAEEKYEDAVEFFNFNILGAWMGEGTPCFMSRPEPWALDGPPWNSERPSSSSPRG